MTTSTVPATLTGNYTLDPSHSRVGFVARHAMVTKVRGAFNAVSGTGWFDADDAGASHLDVVIQAASIDTRSADRDEHLRTGDFLDVASHPEIRFASTEVAAVGEGTYRVTGGLTIKGTTRPVTFEVELTGPAVDPFGNTRIGLEGSVVVNRKDWGITWNAALDTGGVLVSDKITLEFEVSAIRS